MDKITLKQFLFTQPLGEVEQPHDKDYLNLTNRLYKTWKNRALMQQAPDDLKKVVCIALVSYYRDIISDAGVYRSFTDECQRMYGRKVPFHDNSEDYIDYELNLADVEFILWYQLAFNSMSMRFIHPHDAGLLALAKALYAILEDEYDDIPDPEGYSSVFDIDLHDPEDINAIHDLSQWLFWKNWLMVPPFQLTFAQIYSRWVEIQHSARTPEEASRLIEEEKQTAMAQIPTGPLALYLREWLHLIIDGSIPSKKQQKDDNAALHPWYEAFLNATGGKDLAFIKSYRELNSFLIKSLGWSEGEEHLPQFKENGYFVLMVTPKRGLMVAKELARCVKHPENPLYEKLHAEKFAFNALSQRGVCPADMLQRFIKDGCLPDARFPETDDTAIVGKNADFIARAYLQEFYRGDN